MATRKSMKKQGDPAIRDAVLKVIRRDPNRGSVRVVHELGLGACRADLAVVLPDELHGYEFKSELDTLTRLPAQIEHYSAVFTLCTLVVHPKHVSGALKLLPPFWGLWTHTLEGGLTVLRQAQENPELCGYALASLLWKPELQDAVKQNGGVAGLSRATCSTLMLRLVRVLSPEVLRSLVSSALYNRQGWRGAFWGTPI